MGSKIRQKRAGWKNSKHCGGKKRARPQTNHDASIRLKDEVHVRLEVPPVELCTNP